MRIEGRNAVLEALKSGATIDKIMCQTGVNHEIIALARKRKIKLQFTDKSVLDKNSDGKHQGFVAYTTEFNYSTVEDILGNNNGRHFIVLLDGVEDPHNLGSIIRVCECAGVNGIILPRNRSVSVNGTVVKVSSGASSYVKVARVTNLNTVIEQLKQNNIWVYCAELGGSCIYDVDLSGDIALVIGGEGNGVSQLTKSLCDGVVTLDVFGKVNSLNASVACGIAVYEAVRQRRNNN